MAQMEVRIMEVSEQSRIFDEWLSRHKGLLFKVVHAYGFRSHDREDLFQGDRDAGLEFDSAFPGGILVSTWIYRVALNTALAGSRKERKHRDQTQPLQDHEPALRETSQAKNPRLGWLYEQIGQLDHVDRSLTLLLLDGHSYREMAETVGISESYVGVRINRIKAHLNNLTKEEQHHGV
jgi:RNA polymerase sigma-70 factor (ECF subfamily)